MRIHITAPLIAWESLDDGPSLNTLKQFLEVIPDGELLSSLRRARGRGRDKFPVYVLWRTVLASAVCRHQTMQACLDELNRNPALQKLVGITSPTEIPEAHNISRFMIVLGTGPHLALLQKIFNELVKPLGQEIGDLGEHLAGDSTGLSARAGGKPNPDHLPEPSTARKEYTDDQGKVTKVLEWFGYKAHLLVDVKHEVTVAYRITASNVADNEELVPLLADAQANLPADRIQTLAYDKAADDIKVHERLDSSAIAPLIENRSLWKDHAEEMLPGHDGNSNVVYDEAGTVFCYDKRSEPPVRRAMAFIGHEPSRGTLKYRCPAMHGGLRCASSSMCNAGRKYGKTVRVKQAIDLRRFPQIPRATKQFERRYKGRTAVERVNARFKIFWGIDDGNVVGPARFHAHVGVVMVTHIALATLLAMTPRREGPLGQMKLSPIAKALRQRLHR